MQGNTSSAINKSFDVQSTRDSVRTSMSNVKVKVKSSLKEQAYDPPICTWDPWLDSISGQHLKTLYLFVFDN